MGSLTLINMFCDMNHDVFVSMSLLQRTSAAALSTRVGGFVVASTSQLYTRQEHLKVGNERIALKGASPKCYILCSESNYY